MKKIKKSIILLVIIFLVTNIPIKINALNWKIGNIIQVKASEDITINVSADTTWGAGSSGAHDGIDIGYGNENLVGCTESVSYQRSSLKFNLSSTSLPEVSTIESVRLSFQVGTIMGSPILSLYSITDDSWTDIDNSVPSETSESVITSNYSIISGVNSLDVTDFVLSQISSDGVASFVLRGNENDGENLFGFASIENGSSSCASLTITYSTTTPLDTVSNISLSSNGVATWDTNSNATGYNLELFSGSTSVFSTNIADKATNTYDFLSKMRDNGPGTYTVKVIAKGDGSVYSDSPAGTSNNSKTVAKLSTVAAGTWAGTTAKWNAVDNATEYNVQLYDTNGAVGESINVPAASYADGVNFSTLINTNGVGTYTYKVTAKSNNQLFLDGNTSDYSNTYVKQVQLPQVTNLQLSDTGVASWDNVTNNYGYLVVLKDGSSNVIETYTAAANEISHNFLTTIRNNGVGNYTVTVKALGGGSYYLDSNDIVSSPVSVIKLGSLTTSQLSWSENTAHWAGVSNASSYDVQLYKNGIELNSPINVLAENISSGKDFTSVIAGNGGEYTFKVTAKGKNLILDGAPSEVSSSHIILTPLTDVSNVSLSGDGILTWDDVANDNGYQLQLYKNNEKYGDSILTVTNATTNNLLTMIRNGGIGNYKVEIIAIGDNIHYSDSNSVVSDTQSVEKLTTVTAGTWDSSTAKWNAINNASSYDVLLYKDGEILVGPINVALTNYDFSSVIDGNGGEYTFTVKAKGENLYLDADVSQPSSSRIISSPLTQVTNVSLSNDGMVSWDDIEHESKYQLQLYKDNAPYGAVLETAQNVNHMDLLSIIKNAGKGAYKVTVIAVGDAVRYTDSTDAFSVNSLTVTKLDTVAAGTWSGAIAKWTAVDNATGYNVQLYDLDGTVGSAIYVTAANYSNGVNFTHQIEANGIGTYTYTVTAIGDNKLVLDGVTSTASNTYIKKVQLPKATNLQLSNTGVATWDNVSNNYGYSVELKKGSSVIETYAASKDEVTHNFLTTIRDNGVGNYTVSVTALGGGIYYLDSDVVGSLPISVIKLDSLTANNLTWSGYTAHWLAVEHAVSYDVTLYKDGIEQYSTNVLAGNIAGGAEFTSNITGGSGGAYTFKVIAKGENLYLDSDLSASSIVFLPPLTQVTNVTLSSNGVISWDDIESETGYQLQLYKDGTPFGDPINTVANVTTKDLLTIMQNGGVGNYTVSVTAIGNHASYANSVPANSLSQTVNQLSDVTGLYWDGKVAHWASVTNATGYNITLYKNNSKIGEVLVPQSDVSAGKDYSTIITNNEPGLYTFTVKANGDGGLTLGSHSESLPSVNYTNTVKLPTVTGGLTWTGNIAHWAGVADAVSYDVQLYKGDTTKTKVGLPINVLAGNVAEGVDFTNAINSAGLDVYTYTVTVKGNGTYLQDSDVSVESNNIVKLLQTSNTTFDLNTSSSNHKDIEVTIASKYNISSIKDGVTVLTQGTDYTIVNNTVKIFKSYLEKQTTGNRTVTFTFSNGKEQSFTINITKTVTPSNPESGDGSGIDGSTRFGSVEVNNGVIQEVVVNIPIVTIIDKDGKRVDKVSFDEKKALVTVTQANKNKTKTATIFISDDEKVRADRTSFQISNEALKVLGENDMEYVIKTPRINLTLPASTISSLIKQDIAIDISEVTDKEKLLEEKKILSSIYAKSKLLGTSNDIATNYSKKTLVTVPVRSTDLPKDRSKMDMFVRSLAVLVQHSDGVKRVQKGIIQYDKKGNPTGVSIWVDSFSTFTLVKTSYPVLEKTITQKQMPDKVWVYKFNYKLNAKSVNEDNVYVLDSKGSKVDTTVKCYGKYLVIKPINQYQPGETYTLYFTTNLKNQYGKSYVKPRAYKFTIGKIALSGKKIKELKDFTATKAITINLNKKINSKLFKNSSVLVYDENCNKVKASVTIIKNKYVKVTPLKPYMKGKTYYILVKGVKFADNTSLNELKWIKFTTKK